MATIKSFEDFLGRMQGLLDNANKQGQIMVPVEDLENAFPELVYDEDERIRRELISLFADGIKGINHRYTGKDCERWLPWIEKQSKQKPVFEMKTPEESLGIDSETYNKIVDECVYGEQKTAWSEDDETIKNNIIHIIRQYGKISKRENQPCYYVGDCFLWMQNIKDRVQLHTIAYYNPYKEVVDSIAKMCQHYDNMNVGSLKDFYDNVKVKCKDAKEYDTLFLQRT